MIYWTLRLMIEVVKKAKTILVPSGRDHEGCVNVFEDRFAIKVPEFADRVLTTADAGRRFVKVKSRDIPMLIGKGFGDVGITYTDVYEERANHALPITYSIIGPRHLSFSLLFPSGRYIELKKRLTTPGLTPLVVATAYPAVLKSYIASTRKRGVACNITISPLQPTGSVEAMPALGVADAVADVVNTGKTARANNLVSYRLSEIFPAVIFRNTKSVY
jgi:ATP phosphoribosyltransferase